MSDWLKFGLTLFVSVNVGGQQLQGPNFVNKLSTSLAKYPSVNPACLELEILETSALEDVDRVSNIMNAVRELDISFALDDFGTGFSSLTYLKRFPADILKIDTSFVRDMLEDPEDQAIVGGVIALASAFKLKVIAEGVETVDHGVTLISMGCELAQGYGISRPMPANDIPAWVEGWQPYEQWIEHKK
jgi:EAL domain-containing protein (putative c-di-GMP-specific phosphodiesterase class I)